MRMLWRREVYLAHSYVHLVEVKSNAGIERRRTQRDNTQALHDKQANSPSAPMTCWVSPLFLCNAFCYSSSKRSLNMFQFTTTPPQLEPAPAVQPKQCAPVIICRLINLFGSNSPMVCGKLFSIPNSSIWLKSQS